MACGHGGVGGEDAVGGDRFQGRAEGQAVAEVLAQQFQDEEGRVSFVEVPHRRLDAERAQRPHAADAENHFLPHARGFIAAVEAMGNVAIRGLVLAAVGVEQVHRNAAPRLHERATPHGRRCADRDPLAALAEHRLERRSRGALRYCVLHAVVVDRLGEVALLMSSPRRRSALIARGLAVIAGEHPEATEYIGTLVKAVLGEIATRVPRPPAARR